jgi:hypothetical protein
MQAEHHSESRTRQYWNSGWALYIPAAEHPGHASAVWAVSSRQMTETTTHGLVSVVSLR